MTLRCHLQSHSHQGRVEGVPKMQEPKLKEAKVLWPMEVPACGTVPSTPAHPVLAPMTAQHGDLGAGVWRQQL